MGLTQFEVKQMITKKEQRDEARQNQQLLEQVARQEQFGFGVHLRELGATSKRLHQNDEKQVPKLLCSCNGLKCDGICRATHLNRPRFANPKPKKNVPVNKQWAEKCPEAYEQPVNYRT